MPIKVFIAVLVYAFTLRHGPLAYDENGNPINLTYDPFGHTFTAFDANKNPITVKYAFGYAPATKRSYFVGTDYVEGHGYPNGKYTVPAMVNKGERILPTADNLAIGGRDLTNKELVDKVNFYDRFAAQFPNAFNPALLPGDMFARLRLPDSMMKQESNAQLDLSGLRQDMKAVKQAVENKKLLNLSINQNGFAAALVGQQSKTEYIMNQLRQ